MELKLLLPSNVVARVDGGFLVLSSTNPVAVKSYIELLLNAAKRKLA